MNYVYNEISYNKRPLTDDIALSIITNDFSLAERKSSEFEKIAKPIKLGEIAAQNDSCPVADLSDFRPCIGFLKKKFDGFRIRNAQFSGIISFNGTIKNIDSQTTAYLAANGSIAIIAEGYENDSDKVLLAGGIIPLISDENPPVGTFILVRNIKRDISGGNLEAYKVTPESLIPIDIRFNKYEDGELTPILT